MNRIVKALLHFQKISPILRAPFFEISPMTQMIDNVVWYGDLGILIRSTASRRLRRA